MGTKAETLGALRSFWGRRDGGQLATAFNELQVAEYTPLVELKSAFGLSDRRNVQTVTGTGSITATGGEIKLSTGGDASSTADLSTAQFGVYLAGLEAVPGAAFRVGAMPTGEQVVRVGYFDADDGFGVRVDSDADPLAVFLRNGGTETIIRRSDWADPLDGTGPSGFEVDPLDMTIWRMPFRWYGGGPVRFFADVVGEGIYPRFALAHAIGKQDSGVIFENPNLQIRCEVENGDTASNLDLFVGGRQYGVLGRYNPTSRVISEERTGVTVATTGITPLIAIRFKDAFKGRAVIPSGIDILTTSDLSVRTYYNGSLTSASFGDVSDTEVAETAMEVDVAATAYTAGDKSWSGGKSGGGGNKTVAGRSELPGIPLAPDDTFVLAAQAIDAEATVDAWLRWEEAW